jgi:hypothetical protein
MKTTAKSDTPIESKRSPSRQTLLGLDWLNFFLADVQTGVGPFLAIFLAGMGGMNSAWDSFLPLAGSLES